MSEEKSLKKRATSDRIRQRRAASKALTPLVKDIAGWQAEAAYIEALAGRNGSLEGGRRLALLLARFHRGRALASQIIADLPEDIRDHSRVVDVLKALETLAQRLDRIGGGPQSMTGILSSLRPVS